MMLLADTSVWIEHFRQGLPEFAAHLADGLVLMHPFVSGELACTNLKYRSAVLSALNTLPAANRATDTEVLELIDQRKLWGHDLGWIDAHLLASALLSNCRFWTLDEDLHGAATDLGLI
jgi:predicted nucleic acid-binding protein